MAVRFSMLSVLLLSADPSLQAQLKENLKETVVTFADEVSSVPRAAAKRGFDAVIVEARRGSYTELSEVYRAVDPARTVVLAGSRAVLRNITSIAQILRSTASQVSKGTGKDLQLEDFISSKLGVFVKQIRNGTVRNLHPMLITAVERPLIALALRETNGNQIKAAHLLGLNRNTLRKKITDLRIPLKRDKSRKAVLAS
jgi:DNA-binding protein Fis